MVRGGTQDARSRRTKVDQGVVYEWGNTWGLERRPRVPAKVVANWLQDLRFLHGTLTPEIVLDAARDPEAPGHEAFTWDDTKAAHERRLVQARTLVRSVIVRIHEEPARRVFAHVPSAVDHPSSYEPLDVIWEQVDMKAASLSEANAAVLAAMERVRELRRQWAGDNDKVALVGVAMEALGTAQQALGRLS